MRVASTEGRLAVVAVVAAAMILEGCALQLATGACNRPAFFWEDGTNIVIAPPAGQVEPDAMQHLSLVGGMIQSAAASVGQDYRGIKVVRLVPSRADDPSCRQDAIRYQWSGCSRKVTLIDGDPVVVMWPYAQPGPGDDMYVRFSISNWIVGGSFGIRLELTTAKGRRHSLEATVPVENVTFRPRRISRQALDDAARAFGCDLYDSPDQGAARRRLENCERVFEGIVARDHESDGRKWLEVTLPDGGRGWLPAPRMEDVGAVFPEFGLLEISVSFQEFLRSFPNAADAARQHRRLDRAVQRFRETPVSTENAAARSTAEVILGSAELLQGARDDDRGMIEKASTRFAKATSGLAYQSEAVNLNLLAELLRCCLTGRADVGANRIRASLAPLESSAIEAHAMRMWAFLKLDPASDTMLRNLVSLLTMLQDAGRPTFGDASVSDTLARLAPMAAASLISPRGELLCEELKRQASAQN